MEPQSTPTVKFTYQGTERQAPIKRISRRRAGAIEGNTLFIFRLRRPNKDGVQKVRDLVKALSFESPEQAFTALELKIKEAQSRELLKEEAEDTVS